MNISSFDSVSFLSQPISQCCINTQAAELRELYNAELPCTEGPSFYSKIELCSWKRNESSSRYMCSTLVLRHGSIHLSDIHKRLAVHLSKRNDHNQSVGVRTCTLGALVAKECMSMLLCCDPHSIATATSMRFLRLLMMVSVSTTIRHGSVKNEELTIAATFCLTSFYSLLVPTTCHESN